MSPSPNPVRARTGINSVVRTPGANSTAAGESLTSSSKPLAVRATFSFCGLSVRLVISSVRREVSPLAIKRGMFSSAITGAATITLLSLLPKSSAVQACAMTRNSPLKSPIGSATEPSPCSLSVTGSACCATILT